MANISSMSELRKKQAAGESAEGSQSFYAGGGSNGGSGTSVLGPPKGGDAARVIAAAKAGSSQVSGPSSGSIKLILYSNGFQVDDGPFRGDTPADKQFMADIAAGKVPAELQSGAPGPVDVNIVDKRSEEYSPPPAPAFTAFEGSGQALAAGSAIATDNIIVAAAVQQYSVEDDGSGTVRVQVKLPAGKRSVLTVPKSCSVGALCAKIANVCDLQVFQLVSGFPPQPISTDFEQTVVAAGLAGGTVQVKEA